MRRLRGKKEKKWDLRSEDRRYKGGAEQKWQKEQAKTTRYAKERRKVRMRISETWKEACGTYRLTEFQRNTNKSRVKKVRVGLEEKKKEIE